MELTYKTGIGAVYAYTVSPNVQIYYRSLKNMKCPNCERHFDVEDYNDNTPFQCEHCAQWLELDCDEGTYEGAVKRTLVMLDEDDVD
jgi:ribosomal protein L37AE/L43A